MKSKKTLTILFIFAATLVLLSIFSCTGGGVQDKGGTWLLETSNPVPPDEDLGSGEFTLEYYANYDLLNPPYDYYLGTGKIGPGDNKVDYDVRVKYYYTTNTDNFVIYLYTPGNIGSNRIVMTGTTSGGSSVTGIYEGEESYINYEYGIFTARRQ